MEFRTPVEIEPSEWKLKPTQRILFIGSCFADHMAKRCRRDKFCVTANPFGTMYNPASVFNTARHTGEDCQTVVLTFGTNHVYILKETGEIVDNCQKRPQNLFEERDLSVEECVYYIKNTCSYLREMSEHNHVRIIATVSPIRYRKYGFHESQLSKATLLLALNQIEGITYFPAYEIFNDELRDYRFYAADMLHPSEQAIEYVWQRFSETFYGDEMHAFLKRWRPIEAALEHKPFNPDSPEYKEFMRKTNEKLALLKADYPQLI